MEQSGGIIMSKNKQAVRTRNRRHCWQWQRNKNI
nr:MAG TPA: Beta-ketoacyl synthase [Caudoviricetes sp.]DAO92665.1 MAG TPA: Beta-ketoacyl synthase [Caudoviricetes sp.]